MITGSCLCGVVRYEIPRSEGPTYNCHCSRCRKWSGSAFASSMRAPLESLSVTAGAEAVSRYESSPGVLRCFCRHCGSSLFTERHDRGVCHIRLGTTDGDPGVRPEFHAFVSSKALWWEITDDRPQLEGSSFGWTPAP
ncbi:MAG TPA: GFA family protein [Caulobacteraceae bacterium]|nr:GFA family protein [Caulobacteraceae bacterium]